MIYGPPSYQMGDDEAMDVAPANQPITPAQAQQARAELARMKRSLERWLRFRAINDQTARELGTRRAFGAGFWQARRLDEQRIATRTYQLLSEIFDPQSLPSPDLRVNPNAAVELATIAIGGQLPGESTQATGLGFIWLWPAVIVIGAIAFVVAMKIRSDADTAQEREKIECIKSGKCTDYGFWLKAGGVAAVAWFAWDKLGLRERVQRVKGRAAAGRR